MTLLWFFFLPIFFSFNNKVNFIRYGSTDLLPFHILLNKLFLIYRIIEIAGGREVFSQSRGKVAARKPRFLAASNSHNSSDGQSDNKLSLKKNNRSPNRQTVWELRSRWVFFTKINLCAICF